MRRYAIEHANGRAETGEFDTEEEARRWLDSWIEDYPEDLNGAKLIDRVTREVLWSFHVS